VLNAENNTTRLWKSFAESIETSGNQTLRVSKAGGWNQARTSSWFNQQFVAKRPGGPMTDHAPTNQPMLLLTEGGPIYRIEKRLGLIREHSPCIVRRAFLSVLLTWVPLFALSVLQGNAVGHHVAVPFLRDFAVHGRFILAVPLLIFAEVILGPHLGHASVHFIHSGVVLEEDFKRFDSAMEQGLRCRDSTLPEFLLVSWHISWQLFR
jgi:hypothetical protein